MADHRVKGQSVLPGVAYLEMARAAVEQATGGLKENHVRIQLKNIVWIRPITVGEQPVTVHIGLFPEDRGEIAFEIYSESEEVGAKHVVHSQGHAVLSTVERIPSMDLTNLQAQCSHNTLSSSQCYETFKSMGLQYGPGHQGIEIVYVGSGQVLAKLSLPFAVSDTLEQFVLHPSLLDSALQTSIGLMMDTGDISGKATLKPFLPFALHEFDILSRCTPSMWALIRFSDGSKAEDKVQKLDIDLCDEQGHVCIRMKGFSSRVLEGEVGLVGASTFGTLLLHPSWEEQAAVQDVAAVDYVQHVAMFCEPSAGVRQGIETPINGMRCLALESKQEGIAERFQDYALQAFEEIQSLLKGKIPGKVLIQIVTSIQDEQQLFAGLGGLLKTAQAENPKLIGQLLEIAAEEDWEGIIEKLEESGRSSIDKQIRYQDSKRYAAGWNEVAMSPEAERIPWKDQGVYLITGGAGGLGQIFAREIAHKVQNATLILTGRSVLTEHKQAQLKEIEALGVRLEYKQVDVTQKEAVADLLQSIKRDFKNLNGILHGAGVIRDNFILKKTKDELLEVMAPKVSGVVHLDQASKELPLDFFVLFSSVAGSLGNAGQSDYAVGNAFMDAYAKYRNTLVASQERHGQTLSINWPLWQEGGMHIDAETEKMMKQSMGMIAMQTSTGIRALYQALASGEEQVMVTEGDLSRMQANLLERSPAVPAFTEAASTLPVEPWLVREKTVHQLKVLFGEITKMSIAGIDPEEPLESYGIDSIMITQLNQKLDGIFGELSKTLFYEYQTLNALAEYFIADYLPKCLQWTGLQAQVPSMPKRPAISPGTDEFPVLTSLKKAGRKLTRGFREGTSHPSADEPIAIIGMSGRYPQAKTLKDYWENLKTGRDCISEIPQERWSLEGFYHSDSKEAVAQGKSYSKWGGFVEGFADFDPLFFSISPREAINMDPQER